MLKRDPVKYIRDKAKSGYEKGTECRICGAKVRLDFHHFKTLALLVSVWLREKNKLLPEHYTADRVTLWRDEFIHDHWAELYEEAETLCHDHHLKLHSVYGRNPPLHTAEKQKRWVEIQREKHGLV
jgi:hypothetical protein